MNEHQTWFDLLFELDSLTTLKHNLQGFLGRENDFLVFTASSYWTLTHVLGGVLVFLFVLYGTFRFSHAMKQDDAMIPSEHFSIRTIFELITEATYSMLRGILGDKHAKQFLPLIGSLAFFIFFSNIMSLIPGFAPATDSLKTTLALALIVFGATHYYGFKEHGFAYLKQFLGPVIWLAPLMLPIELISHFARPLSLSLRLVGNISSDHKVIAAFFLLIPFLVPIPFLMLGIIVSIVQTFVFCLLSTIYLSMAIAHDH